MIEEFGSKSWDLCLGAGILALRPGEGGGRGKEAGQISSCVKALAICTPGFTINEEEQKQIDSMTNSMMLSL